MTESETGPVGGSRRSSTIGMGLLFLAALVAAYLWTTRPVPPPEGWSEDYAAALREAAATGRNVLIDFYLRGCAPCRVMDRTVMTAEPVKKALSEFVLVRLDLAAEDQLADRFQVVGAPTYVVLNPEGRMLSQTSGILTVEQFVTFLEQAAGRSAPSGPPAEGGPPSGP
jgi:thiol:disulfide interchange protein